MKKYPIIGKSLSVGIILLFIGICIIPTISQDTDKSSQSTSRGNWLYVGGSGPGNYTTIQDAIDNTTNGDTVFVYRGTYYEKIEIYQKSITLLGENVNLTIIDIDTLGGNAIQVINAPNVTIDGFGFKNHFTINVTGSIWADHCPGLMIRNVSDSWYHVLSYGFRLRFSNHSTITRTVLKYKIESAIDIQNSSNVTISENSIVASIGYMVYSCGISLTNCEDIMITKNMITKCILYGISLLNSHKNSLVGNNVRNNNASGIYLLHSNNNLISNNELSSNDEKGIFIENSKHNTISKNNIYGNGGEQIFFSNAFFNKWNQNFWGDWSSKKHHIEGLVHLERINISFPIWKVDWYPANRPYDIPGIS
jgi:parallel beta-helix repeat protein